MMCQKRILWRGLVKIVKLKKHSLNKENKRQFQLDDKRIVNEIQPQTLFTTKKTKFDLIKNIVELKEHSLNKEKKKQFQPNKLRQEFFEKLKNASQEEVNKISIEEFRTKNGKTQQSERQSIKIIKEILKRWKFIEINRKQKYNDNVFKSKTFYINSSQKPNDFIIKLNNDLIIKIEVKKTNSNRVILNDTLPFQTDYIIFCSKKIFEHPKVLYIDGRKIKKKSWIDKLVEDLDKSKQLAKQGKDDDDIIRAYPRPNYSMSIKKYLEEN